MAFSESSPTDSDKEDLELDIIFLTMKYFGIAITLLAFLNAWYCTVTQNTFKNFVLFNTVIAIALRFIILEVCSYNWAMNIKDMYELQMLYWSIMYYLHSAFTLWIHSFFYVLYDEYLRYHSRDHPFFNNKFGFTLLNWVVPFFMIYIILFALLLDSSNNHLINFHIIAYSFIFVPNTVLNVIMCKKFVTAVKDVYSNQLNSLSQGIHYLIVILIFICNNMTAFHWFSFFENSPIFDVIRTFLSEYLITIILDMYILIENRTLVRKHLHHIYTHISACCCSILNLSRPRRGQTNPDLGLTERAPAIPDLGLTQRAPAIPDLGLTQRAPAIPDVGSSHSPTSLGNGIRRFSKKCR